MQTTILLSEFCAKKAFVAKYYIPFEIPLDGMYIDKAFYIYLYMYIELNTS